MFRDASDYGCVSAGIFFFKQKTAYEMRISDWSADVCSSDLASAEFSCSLDGRRHRGERARLRARTMVGAVDRSGAGQRARDRLCLDLPVLPRLSLLKSRGRADRIGGDGAIYECDENGRASCRERVCPDV